MACRTVEPVRAPGAASAATFTATFAATLQADFNTAFSHRAAHHDAPAFGLDADALAFQAGHQRLAF